MNFAKTPGDVGRKIGFPKNENWFYEHKNAIQWSEKLQNLRSNTCFHCDEFPESDVLFSTKRNKAIKIHGL